MDHSNQESRYWPIFFLVASFAFVGQLLWATPMSEWWLGSGNILPLLGFNGLYLLGVVVLQLWLAPKVFPLLYLTPVLNVFTIQAFTLVGWGAGGLIGIAVVLVALNSVALALSWNEITASTCSLVVEPWLSLAPVSCLLILASGTLLSSPVTWGRNGAILPWVIGPPIWFAIAGVIVGLVVTNRHTSIRSDRGEALSAIFFVLCIITLAQLPVVIVLSLFDVTVFWVFITVVLVEFGLASARFDTLRKYSWGARGTIVAFVMGCYTALGCAVLSILMMTPWR